MTAMTTQIPSWVLVLGVVLPLLFSISLCSVPITSIKTSEKIAVVTGGNKGIGYAIVQGLCKNYNGTVYLTARDENRGKEAVKKLNALGLKPLFHQLDVKDQQSINNFRDHIQETYSGIDVLINNAAISFKHDATESFAQQAEETIAVNYFGLLRVCTTLFPLLKQNGRVINLSSKFGHLSYIPSEDLRKKLSDPSLTVANLSKLMEKFVSDAKTGKQQEEGWNNSAYVVSKVGCTSLSIIQQREFDNEKPFRNISVNAVHPGYVNTDLTNHRGRLTIEQGAAAPLYLALEDHGLKGKYVWSDKQVVDWYGPGTP